MNIKRLVVLRIVTWGLLVSVTSLIAQETEQNKELSQEEIQQKIDALIREINEYRNTLNSSTEKKRGIEKSLEENEKKIGELQKKTEQTRRKIQQIEGKIGSLEKREKKLQISKVEQKELIVHHIKAAYMLGKQEYLKVLLNQEDPHQLSRMLTYYDYMNRERLAQINRFNNTIKELEKVEKELLGEREQHIAERKFLEDQNQSLSHVSEKRLLTLKELNEFIATTDSALEERTTARRDLESLLGKITANIANLPTPEETLPFGDMKGKLNLPVNGKIVEQFGNSRNEGKLKWNGLYISASRGEPIQAVHYGRVVFSDWLRGFGLLMIINHGEGYMSLYGHNQLLYKETGEWVSKGEIIARAGNSGGQPEDGLYFEIRQAGKPTDPLQWCQISSNGTA